MPWEKLGCVFTPERQHPWMWSHASHPVPEHVGEDRFRVYFSCRDAENRSHVGWVEIDLPRPREVLRVSDTPVLAPGEPGLFDDSGVSLGCIVPVGAQRYLYYVGWNLGVTVPWRNSIGLAVSEAPDEPFVKVGRAPVLDRSDVDPFSLSYPWVLREGDRWRMWYGTNLAWGATPATARHVIRCADSGDGRAWDRREAICVALHEPAESALTRPCVVQDADGFHMWYSIRGEGYRIGHATSADGLAWEREDGAAALDPSPEGWDAGSVAYPCVFAHRGSRYMLYNGRDYGKTGFGLARWHP